MFNDNFKKALLLSVSSLLNSIELLNSVSKSINIGYSPSAIIFSWWKSVEFSI